ncbi:MAG: restriction endonuclease subunit S [Oscillospiraceae bacterium]|jgi:type I restriction enzyme S subunit|nr:restriction endonuclease subunit S [Oscillospiraceae bacterium]
MAKKTKIPKGWKTVRLGEIATPIKEKTGGRKFETLSISAGVGFVNQSAKFGRELSGKQYVNYVILHCGDFSFNKGNSRRYPYGCTYMLRNREIAAVPNVFYSFRIADFCGEFYEQLFLFGWFNRQLKRLINTGVRDDGLFNLYKSDFYGCTVPLPPLLEQTRIAEILTTADKLIAVKERLIAAKRKQKRWLMQNLLTGRIRLPGFDGKWESVRLGEVCIFRDSERVPIESQERQSRQGAYPYYGASGIIDYVDDYLFDEELILLGEDGANILNRSTPLAFIAKGKYWVNNHAHVIQTLPSCDMHFLCGRLEVIDYTIYNTGTAQPKLNQDVCKRVKLTIPSLPEQRAIAERLTAADREIELLSRELEQQRQVKKYLMQQLLTGRIRTKGANV